MAIEVVLLICFWGYFRSLPALVQITIAVVFLLVLGRAVVAERPSLRVARRCTDKGNYIEAAQILDAHLKTDPEDSEALYLQGICALGLGNPEEAVRIWQRARASDRFHWKSSAALSLHYLDQGDELRACALYVETKERGASGKVFEEKLTKKYGANEANNMIRQAKRLYSD